MSMIDKLQILGVRSFDNTHGETIQFQAPLTLIVGYNGSGKTTIIECLKYATTGDLPPNSKGGAFIHDPKLCGEREVMAQVKLALTNTSGVKMVCTRSLQLTVKKATRTQKTLEGSLMIVRHGERTSISTRVAELDQIMPQHLGVSKAVLDNVIFCHQDESLWPMSEPSVLKKKFDEIFDALKYTKAIDNIKQLRKKQNEELAKYKIMEQYSKEDKDKGDRLEKRSLKLQDEIEGLRGEVKELEVEAKKAMKLADEAWEQAGTYNQILIDLQVKRGEADTLQKSLRELKGHLRETSESDEWLESTLEQFESRLIQYKEQQASKGDSYHELKQIVEESRKRLGEKRQDCGRIQANKDRYERQLAARTTLIKDTARQYRMRGYGDSMDDAQVSDFMHKIRKMLKDSNNAVQRARSQADTELREANSLLNQLSQRKNALQENKVAAKKQIASNDREASGFQNRLNEITFDEGSKATIESKIEDLESQLAKAKSTAEAASWESSLRKANAELKSLEEESTSLNAELVEGTKKASGLARLDHLKKELKERQRSLETMSGAHGDRLEKLVGQRWKPANLDSSYQNVLRERSNELTSAERDRDGANRELGQVEFKLKSARNETKRKQKDLQDSVRKIHDAINAEPSEYAEILKTRQIAFDTEKGVVRDASGMGDYYNLCLTAATEKNVCRTCIRPFRKEEERTKFLATLHKYIDRAKKQAVEDTLKPLEEDLEAARDAQTHYDTWNRLENDELPALQKEIEEFDSQREELLNQVEDYDKTVSTRTEAKIIVDSLARIVANITKYDQEIKSFESQIHDLSAQQSQQGLTRTLEDIQEQLARVSEQTRAVKQTITKLSNEKDKSRTELSGLELELSNVRNELSTANFQLDKKSSLAARVQEFKVLNQKQRETIDKADQDIEKLVPEVSKAQAKYDDLKDRAESKEKELQEEASKLADSVRQLDLASEEIRVYLEKGGPDELARGQREIKTIEQNIQQTESEQAALTSEINNITTQLQDSENTKRQYSDNLRYRKEERRLKEAKAEIQELSASNAESDRDRFQQEGNRRRNEHNLLAGKQQGKIGEMKSKDNQLAELYADWNTDYKDAKSKFKEAHIKVETTKAAVEDLGRYAGALDQAIMKYHGLKMEEINRIIEELWQTTYQGTDIDTIAIKSDHENAKGARSYNYRVCMVKQDVEMDMRGRCSAGQKVLASIIIRLALAECFGVNCGIIALDEPTTNLDSENIRSLARSLHDIIKTRQQQANFQLIVITHDEEFLRSMQCGDFSDYYYRVSRNERQKSIIERQSIAEVI